MLTIFTCHTGHELLYMNCYCLYILLIILLNHKAIALLHLCVMYIFINIYNFRIFAQLNKPDKSNVGG